MPDSTTPASFVVRVLDADGHIAAAFPLMRCLRDRIEAATFVADVRRQQRDGYVLAGGYLGPSGAPVTLAGFRVSHTLARGPHLFVDDLVTDPVLHRNGYGTAMIAWLRAYAAGRGLPTVWLDSRATAKGFYERLGFELMTSVPCRIAARAPDGPTRVANALPR